MVVAFRRHTLLPLDDCLYALQPTIPHLTRSSLHRCLQRHGISRLPQVEGEASPKRKFKAYPIGFFHVDIAEVQTARAFWRPLSPPCLTGLRSCSPTMESSSPTCRRNRSGPTARLRGHPFDRACREHGIEHRLTGA